MTETEVAVRLEAHGHEIGSLKHRMQDQEEQSKTIQELVLSVKELALTMQAMLKEQATQGERLAKLEAEPANKWRRISDKTLDVAVGLIVGALITGLIIMVAQNI